MKDKLEYLHYLMVCELVNVNVYMWILKGKNIFKNISNVHTKKIPFII